MKKPTERFTETVADYVKYRPGYPQEVLQVMIDKCGLQPNSIIADVGSGTGLLTKLFLDHGNTVYGVEPNAAMRVAAEQYLKDYDHFHQVDASAEATTLADNSVDYIIAGTAFHWFDIDKTKIEFERILRSPGWTLLVWNVRDLSYPLIRDYEALISDYGTDYCESRASKFEQTAIREFFLPFEMQIASFRNSQTFDWPSFKGRLLSASYSLRPEDTRYDAMMSALKNIFDRHQQNNTVEFVYATKLYYGRMK